MPKLLIKNVNKIYSGGVQAIYDFNLEVDDHEFVVLVGPSGCGKSTMLRMIAGLEEISSGEIILDNKVINNKAPADRNISMVFQNYALYGNMSVYENIGFSKIISKNSKEEIYDAVMKAKQIVNLTDEQLNRKPNQLSGGQRQRVSLGRAITKDTKLCLMDEPLSNLDAKLRCCMRSEITRLYKQLNQTIIYVTHDQTEAMTMATKIVCMNLGKIQQVGTPIELYRDPANLFVANFIGTTQINLIKGRVENNYFIDGNNAKINLKDSLYDGIGNTPMVTIGCRSEYLTLGTPDDYDFWVDLKHLEFLGDRQLVYADYYDGNQVNQICASVSRDEEFEKNEQLFLKMNREFFRMFDSNTGLACSKTKEAK